MKSPMLLVLAAFLVFSTTTFPQNRRTEKPRDKVKDPVCGLMVEKDPKLTLEHNGHVHYFCSKADMEELKNNPDRYTKTN